MIGIIYKITNNITNKVYVGQTIQKLKDRWYRHCSSKGNKGELNMHIKRSIIKYGKENFSISLLEECNVEDLDERERYWIKFYNSYENGYNETIGGQDGRKPLKLKNDIQEVIDLYNSGKSLRLVAKTFNVDHATIKHILDLNNVSIRDTRTYKLSQSDRQDIINKIKNGSSRKDIQNEYKISKSYLSQLINGNRRI